MSTPALLHLVRHAPTAATRARAFPAEEPLDEAGCGIASRLRDRLRVDRTVTSPAGRCRETAALAGLAEAAIDARLAELDFGDWAGRSFADVWADDTDALQAWLDDPELPTPNGETFGALRRRVLAAFDDLRAGGVATAVVTHGGPIRAAVLHVLQAPVAAVWALDIAPATVTTLRDDGFGGWSLLHVGAPLFDEEPT